MLDDAQNLAVVGLAFGPRALSFVELAELGGLLGELWVLAKVLCGLHHHRAFFNWILGVR